MSPMLLLALLDAPAHAERWQHDLSPAGPGAPLDRAEQALDAALGKQVQRALLAEHALAGGATLRFEQTYRGVPVVGATLAVRVRPDGSVPLLRDGSVTGLSVDVTPGLSLLAAAALPAERVARGRLAVLPQGAGVLVWELLVHGDEGPEWHLVDAHSGALLHSRPAEVEALGRVYEENPARTPDTSDLELLDLDEGGALTGWSGNFRVLGYASGNPLANTMVVSQDVGPSSGDDFLYDPPSDPLDGADAFAEVNTYHHVTLAKRYFADLTGEDFTASSWELVAVANGQTDGSPLDNAYFNPAGLPGAIGAPNLILIGQGSRADFAVDADVFVHEFGHYVSGNAVGYNQGQLGFNSYGLAPWTGSIDEGIADYFATSIFDDPVLGEYSLEPLGAERDLSELPGRCPEDIVGEVHEDGKLVGYLGWALREAYGAEAADAIVWGAVTLMSAESDLGDFGAAVRALGEEALTDGLITDLGPLETALAETGLGDCGVVRDLAAGPMVSTMWGMDLLAANFGGRCEDISGYFDLVDLQTFFHFTLASDEQAAGLRFDVSLDPSNGGDLSWRVALREGAPVSFEAGLLLPVVSQFDLESEVFTGETGSITVEGDDFTPGSTWYGVILSDSCPISQVTVTGEVLAFEPSDSDPTADSDAGVDSGTSDSGLPTEDKGSCACDGGSSGAAGWLGLIALGLIRRRRRG